MLVRSAYDVQFFRLLGLPAWANEERFDAIAKDARPITEAERRLMLRSLLSEQPTIYSFPNAGGNCFTRSQLRTTRCNGPQ